MPGAAARRTRGDRVAKADLAAALGALAATPEGQLAVGLVRYLYRAAREAS